MLLLHVKACSKARYFNVLGGLGVLLWLAQPTPVKAQSSYNPYEPINNQFRAYSRPGGLNMFDAMSNNRSQNSNYQAEMDRLFGGRETDTGLSRDKNRYYNAFRKYDEEFDRLYRPNQDVDKAYNQRRSSRESIYFKALREKDPKKKSELMKSYARGEELSALEDDQKKIDGRKSDDTSKSKSGTSSRFDSRKKSRSSSSRSRTSSGMLDSGRSGLSGRSSGGLLGGLNENDDDDDDLMEDSSETSSSRGSLTQRSGRLSEQFRPSDPPRGFGSFKSREELKKAQQSKSAKSDLDLPGFPTFRP